MRRRDFFKRLGTVSAVVAIPTLTIAAIAAKSSEPELVTIKTNGGHYTREFLNAGQKYRLSYYCKMGPGDTITIDNVSVHQTIEDHYMKGVGQLRVGSEGGVNLGFNEY